MCDGRYQTQLGTQARLLACGYKIPSRRTSYTGVSASFVPPAVCRELKACALVALCVALPCRTVCVQPPPPTPMPARVAPVPSQAFATLEPGPFYDAVFAALGDPLAVGRAQTNTDAAFTVGFIVAAFYLYQALRMVAHSFWNYLLLAACFLLLAACCLLLAACCLLLAACC